MHTRNGVPLRPCNRERGWCLLAEFWSGCWRKGHEPNDRDEAKCPQTEAEFDAEWERICDSHIARGRQAARRTVGAVRGADERQSGKPARRRP